MLVVMDATFRIAAAMRPGCIQLSRQELPKTRSGARRHRFEMAVALSLFMTLFAVHWIEAPLGNRDRMSIWWSTFAFYARTVQFPVACVGVLWTLTLLMRSRLLLATVVAGASALAIIPEARAQWPGVKMQVPGAGTLRLMSVNQLRGNRDTFRTQALIRSENPDVIAIQEYALEHDQQLSGALAIAYPYTARFPFPQTNGLAVYSRYPMSVERSPSMEFGAGRIMSVMIVAMGREVVLYNIHPTSPGSPSRIAANRRQLSQLLTALKRERRPTIVIGDCNFPLNSQQTDELRDVGLRPADDFGGEGLLWSWSPTPSWPPVTRIDHAFVSNHFAVSSNRIGPPIGSDHRPILVDVQLREERN